MRSRSRTQTPRARSFVGGSGWQARYGCLDPVGTWIGQASDPGAHGGKGVRLCKWTTFVLPSSPEKESGQGRNVCFTPAVRPSLPLDRPKRLVTSAGVLFAWPFRFSKVPFSGSFFTDQGGVRVVGTCQGAEKS